MDCETQAWVWITYDVKWKEAQENMDLDFAAWAILLVTQIFPSYFLCKHVCRCLYKNNNILSSLVLWRGFCEYSGFLIFCLMGE